MLVNKPRILTELKPRITSERQQARSYSVEKSMGKTSLEVQWLEFLPVQGGRRLCASAPEACTPWGSAAREAIAARGWSPLTTA